MATSFYNAKFARGQLISFVTVDGVQEINIFDPKFTKLVQQVKNFQTYLFSDTDKLVNISYVAYATTSLWWVILLYNGFIHPYEIPNGTLIKIPDINDVVNSLQPVISNIGQVVTL